MAAILNRPVVVGAKTRGAQFNIVEHIEWHAHRGIDHLGDEAVAVLVFQAGPRVPVTGWGSLHAFLVVFRELFRWNSGAKEGRHRERIDVLTHEELTIL